MTDLEYTEGPWECGRYNHIVLPMKELPPSKGGGWAIAHIYGDNERRAANARLIAAAPDMLNALQFALTWSNPDWVAHEIVAAAVAKALGHSVDSHLKDRK